MLLLPDVTGIKAIGNREQSAGGEHPVRKELTPSGIVIKDRNDHHFDLNGRQIK